MNPVTYNNCSECPFFKNENTAGKGWCDLTNTERGCWQQCCINRCNMTPKMAIKVLHHHQKWRRSADVKMCSSRLVGIANDMSIRVLRKECRKDKENCEGNK